jgi:DNA-binding transcriptional LysR family regulator
MRHSPEALSAFAAAADSGSFSAAARRLGKSQSAISSAIANLEIDLGVILFDRSGRKPLLTEHGRIMLANVNDILAAAERLDRVASELAGGLEARLSVVLSDTYQSDRFEETLSAFERNFPDLQLECLIAENLDVVALIQSGRAQLGLLAAQPRYAADISARPLPELSEIGLYVGIAHPLAAFPANSGVDADMLALHRELRLHAYRDTEATEVSEITTTARCWLAPGYLMLLEMAVLGFGWAPLPRWMVVRFAAARLHELNVAGWPRRVPVDAIWSRSRPLGKAGSWLRNALLARVD